MAKLPNIIYMHSHDTGRHISPYGVAVDTPNLQRFAEEGVVFRQAFCAGPTCSPSRAALCTGSYLHQNGMAGLHHRGWELNDVKQTWYTTLRAAGYHTVLAGLEHVGLRKHAETGLVHETDLLEPPVDGEGRVQRVVDFLGQTHDWPFFLDVGFFDTHRTSITPEGVQWHNHDESPLGDPRYVRPPGVLPDNATTRQDVADFNVAVTKLDAMYGRILDALEANGLADNTLVIITTDHGIAFPRSKCNLTDHGMGILLMMRGPAGGPIREGKVVDSMVSHIDVYPTICELIGQPIPDHVAGKSFVPLLAGEIDATQPDAVRDAVFSEVTYHAAYEPKRAVRTPRYKYIRYFHEGGNTVTANVDPSVSKDLLRDAGFFERAHEPEQLYDLIFDPAEVCNLAGSADHAEVLAAMRDRLDVWMRETDDPALEGPVPMPAGAVVNPHRQYSPTDEPVTADRYDPANP